jgi:hypothetical protein
LWGGNIIRMTTEDSPVKKHFFFIITSVHTKSPQTVILCNTLIKVTLVIADV